MKILDRFLAFVHRKLQHEPRGAQFCWACGRPIGETYVETGGRFARFYCSNSCVPAIYRRVQE
jgi:hypothetical protein